MKKNNIRLFFIIKSSIVLNRDIIDWTQKIPNPLLFSPSDCLSFNKSNVRQYHTVNPYLVPVCPGSNRHSIHPIPFLRSSRDRVESLSRPVWRVPLSWRVRLNSPCRRSAPFSIDFSPPSRPLLSPNHRFVNCLRFFSISRVSGAKTSSPFWILSKKNSLLPELFAMNSLRR